MSRDATTRPKLTYAERGTPTPTTTLRERIAHSRALVRKIMQHPPPREIVLFQKGEPEPDAPVSAHETQQTILDAVNRLVSTGFGTFGECIEFVFRHQPSLYEEWAMSIRGAPAPPLAKQMTHPPGIAKAADGTPASWEEQTRYWDTHKGSYEEYRAHFRC